MQLVDLIIEGTMAAAALHAKDKQLKVDHVVLTESLKKVLLEDIQGAIEQVTSAYKAHMGETMYRQIINVECNVMAVKALQDCGVLPQNETNKE